MAIKKYDTEIQGQTQHFNMVNKQNEVMKVNSRLKKETGYTHYKIFAKKIKIIVIWLPNSY